MMRSLFCLSDETVGGIFNKEVNYETLPKDKENEKVKEKNLEGQARVNLAFMDNAICLALQQPCRKENCLLYRTIKIDGEESRKAWACQEYKVDFPNEEFDKRYHVALVGEDRVNIPATIKNLETLKEKGARFYCVSCGRVYRKGKNELNDACKCEDFLFKPIENFIDFLKNREEKKVGKGG